MGHIYLHEWDTLALSYVSKAVDGNFLDPAFFTSLVQQQPRVDTMSIPGFFGQTMVHGPAAISIRNETDVTRDIIFCHCKPYSNMPRTVN